MEVQNPDGRIERFNALVETIERPTDARVFGRDASNPYYDLLYWVAKALQPNFVVELGTCTGGSTAHLAAGTRGKVLSIDIEFRAGTAERLEAFGNIELLVADTRSPEVATKVIDHGSIDLLFIDTDHTAEQVRIEMSIFGPIVREGGLILLDDIRMHPCMSAWWDELDEVKLELPEMHWTSFGVIFR
jgi:predicted O-methyltransferase YrrM